MQGTTHNGTVIIVEAKGEPPRRQEFYKYFWTALGQIMLRMREEGARYAIALPIHQTFVRLARELPQPVRMKLNLEFWFVGTEPVQYSIHILYPQIR